jgi:molybdopterin converting factor small subunit
MAKITVKFYSLWNLYLNKNTVDLEADTFDEAMAQLDSLYGNKLREKLRINNLPFTNFKESSTVLVNGVSIRNIKNQVLKDGDILHVFPPIAGG